MKFSRRLSAFLLAGALGSLPVRAANVPRPAAEYAIKLTNGKQVLLSQQRGKVVTLMFFMTTCPHCQHTAALIERLNKEYARRGYQPLAVGFNENARQLVPGFIQQNGLTFPVGYDDREPVYAYLERSAVMRTYVPILLFIDRSGTVRAQYFGDDAFYQNQEKNIRSMLEQLLQEPATARKGRSSRRGS